MDIDTVIERYFAAIRTQDIDGLLSLYAEDATVVLPNGREVHGVAAIGEMQRQVFAAAPMPSVINRILGASSAAVEIEGRLRDGSVRRTANFYQLTPAGRIARLSVYMRT